MFISVLESENVINSIYRNSRMRAFGRAFSVSLVDFDRTSYYCNTRLCLGEFQNASVFDGAF